MTEEKLAALLTRLHDRTMAGKLDWEETTRKNFYQVAFPEYAIRIGPDDHGDLVLRLYNKDNVLMEEVAANQLESHLRGIPALVMMQDLYTAAKRKALNTDKALDELIASLDEKEE